MEPPVLICNEQELLAATGAVSAIDLAQSLWQYVDGVVTFGEDGIDLQPGLQHEGLDYPFTLQELKALALQLEESEVPLQAAAGGPPPSKARLAKLAHDEFASEGARLAEEALGADVRSFAPQAMTTFAWWYEDSNAQTLVTVVAPTEVDTVTDEVLAYALAWQHDRDLILVLSDKHAGEVARRLPWIDANVTIRSFNGEAVALSREAVLASAAGNRARTVTPYALDADRFAWIARLMADPLVNELEPHARSQYLSWHHRGLQVLRVNAVRGGGLSVKAGVQYSRQQPDHKVFNAVLTGPLTDDELVLAVDAVTGSVDAGHARTARQVEHRLQASIGMSPPSALGLPYLAREYPAYRGPGRPGYIDFLGCDETGNLHVVETKVGHDPKVVLQALDYGIWVQANEASIRARHQGWPSPQVPQAGMYLDFVLAAGSQATAVSGYLAGQLEALATDVHWRVFVVDHLDAHPVVLTELPPDALWTAIPGVTSQPVRPCRRT